MSKMFGGMGEGPGDLRKLFEAISGGHDDCDCDSCGGCGITGDVPEKLKETYQKLTKRYEFKPGMLVKWKEGLANKSYPKQNQPGIVIDVLDTPILDHQDDAGTPYYREPLDMIVGVLVADDKFVMYHYDSRRFEPYE